MNPQEHFEALKKINAHGVEYWSARDLQICFGYVEWRNFETTIKKSIKSCKGSRSNPQHHFVHGTKLVHGGQAERTLSDYHLSRFACYLIVQNGDTKNPEIAQAQNYFAIQTRRQELSDDLADAGFKGLYGGLGTDAIKARKGISPKENLADRMDTTELIAYQFMVSQMREKLQRETIRDQRDAMEIYEAVGQEVRAAIVKIGGTPPENIPPVEHTRKVKRRLKGSKPRP